MNHKIFDFYIMNIIYYQYDLIYQNVTTKHVSSAAFGDISTVVQCINNMAKNKDTFRETVNMLLRNLINPMKKIKDDRKIASTQTATIHLPKRNLEDQLPL